MTAPVRKKLIEVSIPLEAINKASKKQKAPKGYATAIHKYWAQRPLAACRAVLFAQLVDDPSSWPDHFPDEQAQDVERRRLHKVMEDMVPWEASNDESILSAARWEIARSVAWGLGEEPPPKGDAGAIVAFLQAKAPPVYDPFSGGGSIPLEAQRLGLRAFGSDLNPVAVLIGKSLVELPPKFADLPPINPDSMGEAKHGQLRRWKGAQGMAADVRYYGQWMHEEAERRVAHLYPRIRMQDGTDATVVAWLWVRTVRSPDPAAQGTLVPLASTFMLSTKPGRKWWVEPAIDQNSPERWHFEVRTGALEEEEEKRLSKGTKTGHGSNFACLLTGSSIDGDYIKGEGRAGRLGSRMLAIVVDVARRRFFVAPSPDQELLAASVSVPPDIADLPTSTHSQYMGCVPYGLDNFKKLYTARQLISLQVLSDLVSETHIKIARDCERLQHGDRPPGYADAIATYLAFMVDRAADYGSSLSTWLTDDNAIRGTFGRQALPMTWDYCEGSFFGNSSAALKTILGTVTAVVEHQQGRTPGSIIQLDAAGPDYPVKGCAISTDPPYYDNIPYADLSDYFYVWMRRSLVTIWPELFRTLTVPKERELVADTTRHGGRDGAELFFMEGMRGALGAMRRAASDYGPIIIYYAFKQAKADAEGITSAGWSSFLQSIVDAGLAVDATWPLRTESAGRLRGNKSNALASSIVLVCRKRDAEAHTITRAELIRALKSEMPRAIADIRKAGVGPVDMQQSVIGPGMGVFSRYHQVLEDDDSTMSVKTALALINRVWEEIENDLDNAFDPETQVALAWFGSYGFDTKPSGELITLANAKNTPINALFASGVFIDLRGKAALTPREELPTGWSPARDHTLTVWECVQHSARVLNAKDGGAVEAARLVKEMGSKAADARALAYRLYEIATRKGWSAEALVYNELAQEWPNLEDLAASDRSGASEPSQRDMFAS